MGETVERCRHGHERTSENTYYDNQGYRRCRPCRQESRRRSRHGGGESVHAPFKSLPVDPDLLEAAVTAVEADPVGWVRGARCAPYPKDVFFPPRGATDALRRAIGICAGCPVRYECLAANIHEQFGVFGGATLGARRRAWRALRVRGIAA